VNTLIGIGMTCVGSILDAVGYVIQKKGHMAVIELNEIAEIEDDENAEVHSFWSNKTWLTGFATCIVGSILNALALSYAAQSLLAPLRSLTLVANAILVTKFLGETFDLQKMVGITLVIIGSVCSVIFGPRSSSETHTVQSLKDNWLNMPFQIFFGVITGLTLLDWMMVKVYERRNLRATKDKHGTTDTSDGEESEKSEESPEVVMEILFGGKFLMPSYTWLAAYFGSVNMLFMKCLTTMVSGSPSDYVLEWFFYLTVVVVIAVNVALEIFRQKALLYFDASFVVPLFQVSLILGSSTMGGVFFEEFQTLSTLYLILLALSIGVTLLGVAVLAYDVGSVYKQMLHKVGIETNKKSDAEKAKDAFRKKRSVASASLQGIPIDQARLKRQMTRMNPMAMRGLADFNMFKSPKSIRKRARTPRLGPISPDGAVSLPEWVRREDSEPQWNNTLKSEPVITSKPVIRDRVFNTKNVTSPLTLNGVNGEHTDNTNTNTNGQTADTKTVVVTEPSDITQSQSNPMPAITEERTRALTFSKSSPESTSPRKLSTIESVASSSPQSADEEALADVDAAVIFVEAGGSESSEVTMAKEDDDGSEVVFQE